MRAVRGRKTAPAGFLYVEPAAHRIGVAPISLRQKQWRRDVGITARKIGRCLAFKITELDAWVDSRRETHEPKKVKHVPDIRRVVETIAEPTGDDRPA